ncbi:MAG: DUF1449 family protein [Opitutales bacterium]|nr:DUF1449 family protein [Opitutales bacterium]
MLELLQDSLRVYNFLFTCLLGLTLFYWLMLIVGMVDLDLLSPDVDVDADIDVDIDPDVDLDMDAPSKPGAGIQILRFFNIGEVPFMVIFSIAIILSWAGSVVSNYYLNPWHSLLLGLLIAGCSFVISLIPTKLASYPFVLLFRRLESSSKHASLEGSIGTVRTAEISEKYGQIEVIDNGSHIILNAHPFHDTEPLKKGDRALVINYDKALKKYGVSKIKPEDKL